ncbi:MAG: LysR family transcriptional regulator [Pseudomonadota bacterium]
MIYDDLAVFAAVARHLSFSAAARQIGVPLSRVSRRIIELEHHLGVKLLERTTRQVRLTEEGRHLLDRCQAPVEALHDITGFADDVRRQTIRITAPPLAARTSIGPKLLDFVDRHPEITIDLTTTNAFLDFFRDNIDLAFRLGPLDDSSLVARRLWSVPYGFCCGRRFAEDHGLEGCLILARLLGLPAIVARQPWLVENGAQVRPSQVLHVLDDLALVRDAVRRNLGVAMLPSDMLEADMRELDVEDARPLQREMYAVYPSKRLLPARVRNLIEFMALGR